MWLDQTVVIRIVEHAVNYEVTVDEFADAVVFEYLSHESVDVSIVDCLVDVDEKWFLPNK